MRVRIFAILILAVVSSMACNHDDGRKTNNNPTIVDITDKTQCRVGTATSVEGTWVNTRTIKTAKGNGTWVTSWTITRSNLKVVGVCTFGNQSVQDSVSEDSSYTSTNILVLGSDSKVSICPASIDAGIYSYQFNGSCLQVSRGADTLTFVQSSSGNQVSQPQNQSQSGFQPIDRSQVPTDPKMPQASSQDDND